VKYLVLLVCASFLSISYASQTPHFEMPLDPELWYEASLNVIDEVLVKKDGLAKQALIKLLELSFPNRQPINIANPDRRTTNVNSAIEKLRALYTDEEQAKYLKELYKMHYEAFLSLNITYR
jgi:hypothetical protein